MEEVSACDSDSGPAFLGLQYEDWGLWAACAVVDVVVSGIFERIGWWSGWVDRASECEMEEKED